MSKNDIDDLMSRSIETYTKEDIDKIIAAQREYRRKLAIGDKSVIPRKDKVDVSSLLSAHIEAKKNETPMSADAKEASTFKRRI